MESKFKKSLPLNLIGLSGEEKKGREDSKAS